MCEREDWGSGGGVNTLCNGGELTAIYTARGSLPAAGGCLPRNVARRVHPTSHFCAPFRADAFLILEGRSEWRLRHLQLGWLTFELDSSPATLITWVPPTIISILR